MAEPYLGEIGVFSFATKPHGWLLCDGSLQRSGLKTTRVRHIRLKLCKRMDKTLKTHLPGVLTAYRLGAIDAVAESINSQIRAAIVKAQVFQSLRSFPNIIFLTTGRMHNLPTNLLAHMVNL